MTVKIRIALFEYNTSAAISPARYLTDVVFGRFHVVRAYTCSILYITRPRKTIVLKYIAWTGIIINTTLSLLILYYTIGIQVLGIRAVLCRVGLHAAQSHLRNDANETGRSRPKRFSFSFLLLHTTGGNNIIIYSMPTPVRPACVHYGAHFILLLCSDRLQLARKYIIVFGARSVMITLLYSIESASVQMIDQLIGCAKHDTR